MRGVDEKLPGSSHEDNQKNPIHDYLTAGKFQVILYAQPGTVCSDTILKTIDIKVPVANAFVILDTCNFDAILINPSRHVFNKSRFMFKKEYLKKN